MYFGKEGQEDKVCISFSLLCSFDPRVLLIVLNLPKYKIKVEMKRVGKRGGEKCGIKEGRVLTSNSFFQFK